MKKNRFDSQVIFTIIGVLFLIVLPICAAIYATFNDIKTHFYDEGVERGILRVIENPNYYPELNDWFEDKFDEEVQALVDDGTDYEDAIEAFNWMQNELVFYTDNSNLYHRITCGALSGQTFHVTFRNGNEYERLKPHFDCCEDYYGY